MIKYYIIRHHFCQVRIRAADKSPNMGIDPLTAAAHILIEQSALWKNGQTGAPSVHCQSPSRCFQILRCRRKTVLSYIKFLWLEIAVIFPLERTFVMRLGQKKEMKIAPTLISKDGCSRYIYSGWFPDYFFFTGQQTSVTNSSGLRISCGLTW